MYIATGLIIILLFSGTGEYVCSTLIAAKPDDEPDTPTDEDEEKDDDDQPEVVQKAIYFIYSLVAVATKLTNIFCLYSK